MSYRIKQGDYVLVKVDKRDNPRWCGLARVLSDELGMRFSGIVRVLKLERDYCPLRRPEYKDLYIEDVELIDRPRFSEPKKRKPNSAKAKPKRAKR